MRMKFDPVTARELRDWLTKRKQQRDHERAQLEWYKKIFEETSQNIVKNEIDELEVELSVFYDIDIHTKTRYEEDTKYYALSIRYVPKDTNELNLSRSTRRSIINHHSLDEVHKKIRDFHKEIKDELDDVVYALVTKLYLRRLL